MMRTIKVLIWKRDIFCKFKEIKGLCGGEHVFAAQATPQVNAEIAENSRFRTSQDTVQERVNGKPKKKGAGGDPNRPAGNYFIAAGVWRA